MTKVNALVAGLFSLEPFAVFPNDKLLNWFPYIQISATAGQAFSIGSVNFNLIYLYVPSSIFVNCSPFEPALSSVSIYNPGNVGSNAIDGDVNTSWIANGWNDKEASYGDVTSEGTTANYVVE